MINLIKFTENDKRLVIALLLIVILFFVIIGYISLLVKKIMKFQSKRADELLHDVYMTKTVTTERGIRRFGRKKNWFVFFKQALAPILIILAAWILFLVYGFAVKKGDFSLIKIFDYGTVNEDGVCVGGEGIDTLFFIYDWNNLNPVQFLFFKNMWIGLPTVVSSPHWSWDAWFSYIFIPANLVGIIWYLIAVQAYIARAFRIYKLSVTLFKKTLEDVAPLDNPPSPAQTEPQQLTNKQ